MQKSQKAILKFRQRDGTSQFISLVTGKDRPRHVAHEDDTVCIKDCTLIEVEGVRQMSGQKRQGG